MKMIGKKLLTSACVLALAGNGVGVGLAQGKKKVRTAEPVDAPTLIYTADGASFSIRSDNGQEPKDKGPEITHDIVAAGVAGAWVGAGGQQGGDNVFQFFSQEMSFENRNVKGAPFSADTLSETIQTLSDGNRIVQRTEGRAYRDGEGRTRQERSFHLAGANEERQTINIFDPVGNQTIILEPENKIARKMNTFARLAMAVPDGRVARTQGAGVFTSAQGVNVVEFGTTSDGNAATFNRRAMTSANVLQSNAVKKVQPTYPPIAKAAKAAGPVLVQIIIGENGEVQEASAVSGHPLLREAAVEAAKQWQFKPTEVQGKAVKADGVLTFNFSLTRESAGGGAGIPAIAAQRIGPLGQTKTESLGKQMVEGVECEGTRTISSLPAGAIGNERPIDTIFESWYSSELSMTILSKRSDPRFGETTYRVTNINRAEPDAGLFQVPSDYTLKEGPPFPPFGTTQFMEGGVMTAPAERIELRRTKPDQQ